VYQSKLEIEKKMRQAKYALKQLTRYEGRIFVNEGRDPQTGSYPFITDLSSFLTQTRSILQYAYHEAQDRKLTHLYEEFVGDKPIIGCFKDLRDSDIHSYLPRTQQTIFMTSPIRKFDPTTGIGVGETVTLLVESLDDLDNPKGRNSDARIATIITKRINPDANRVQRWVEEGRADLVLAVEEGKPLYEAFEHDGKNDVFLLCRTYLACVEEFCAYGMRVGFIT